MAVHHREYRTHERRYDNLGRMRQALSKHARNLRRKRAIDRGAAWRIALTTCSVRRNLPRRTVDVVPRAIEPAANVQGNAIVTRELTAGDFLTQKRRKLTIISAGVAIDGVAIVTGFGSLPEAVATHCRTGTRTSVAITQISVVTLLTALHEAITARGDAPDTPCCTGCRITSCIALFRPLHDAVAATGKSTVVSTEIVVDLVPVVTLFRTLREAVSARREPAATRSGVVIDLVTVVALLRAFENTVPTRSDEE